MGKGNYPGGPILTNKGDVAKISFKVTAAADVQANGYTLNEGKDHISAVTRTAEGDMKIALLEGFPKFLGLAVISTRANSIMYLDNITDIGSGTDPHIDVTFMEGATPADKDPDSAVMYFELTVMTKKTGAGADL